MIVTHDTRPRRSKILAESDSIERLLISVSSAGKPPIENLN